MKTYHLEFNLNGESRYIDCGLDMNAAVQIALAMCTHYYPLTVQIKEKQGFYPTRWCEYFNGKCSINWKVFP